MNRYRIKIKTESLRCKYCGLFRSSADAWQDAIDKIGCEALVISVLCMGPVL